jgi:hypothetical protein
MHQLLRLGGEFREVAYSRDVIGKRLALDCVADPSCSDASMQERLQGGLAVG